MRESTLFYYCYNITRHTSLYTCTYIHICIEPSCKAPKLPATRSIRVASSTLFWLRQGSTVDGDAEAREAPSRKFVVVEQYRILQQSQILTPTKT